MQDELRELRLRIIRISQHIARTKAGPEYKRLKGERERILREHAAAFDRMLAALPAPEPVPCVA